MPIRRRETLNTEELIHGHVAMSLYGHTVGALHYGTS